MKKIILLVLSIFIASCGSSDWEANIEDIVNSAPVITTQELQINEHAISGTSLGTIAFSDYDEDDTLTISLDSDAFEINETTGEVTVGTNIILDFEATPTLSFTVSVFDGTTTTNQNILLTLNDINEYDILLSEEQKELADDLKFIVLWEHNNSHNAIQKWVTPMTIFLDGTITDEYRSSVQSMITEFNTLFNLGDFSISLVDNLADANTHLYFGPKEDIENLWPDMFSIITSTYEGYFISTGNESVLTDSKIWVSNDMPSLFKHELGHALGLGHSNKCDSEKSVMCSLIDSESDFLDSEKEIIRLLYHKDIAPGTTAEELNNVVANLILLN